MAERKQLGRRKSKHARDGTDGEPRLLREVAYERLKEAIRDGELQPGEALSESRLSSALQISRTPVREALQKLAQEGLVQIMPNRAVTVAAPSLPEALNVLHVRSLVEPEIARLVAESITEEALAVLRQVIEEMEQAAQAGDRSGWSKADTVYHEVLSAACPNALLGKLGLQMRNRIHFLATDAQTTSQRLVTCTEEHREIVEAIAAGEGRRAQEAMQQHIHQLRASFFQRLAHM